MLAALCCMHACGHSERTVNRDAAGDAGDAGDAGESTGGSTGGTTAGSTTGGSAGQATGGAGVVCDYPYCSDGRISIGVCGYQPFSMCNPAVSGVQCVAGNAMCPILGTGGSAGGGIGGSGTCQFPGACDCISCVDGRAQLSACPSPGFIPCDRSTTGVECVSSGACPRIGEGGASGEGGANGEGGAR